MQWREIKGFKFKLDDLSMVLGSSQESLNFSSKNLNQACLQFGNC